MTVYEFCDLCVDADMVTVELWSVDTEEVIFRGTMNDAMWSEYAHHNVESYDAEFRNDRITLNVSES